MAMKSLVSMFCVVLSERVQEGIGLVQLNRGSEKIEAEGGSSAARVQLLAMKETVLGLMKVPQEAVPVLENIEQLLNTSFIHIYMSEQENDRQLHDGLIDGAIEDGDDYNVAVEDTVGAQEVLTEAKDLHVGCRNEEKILFKEHSDCQGREVEMQQDYQRDRDNFDDSAENIGCTDPDSDIWITLSYLSENWNALSNNLNNTVTAVYELKVQEEECAAKEILLNNKVSECNAEDDSQVNAACDYSKEVLQAAMAYKTKFDADKAEFERLTPIWEANSRDRSSQCQLIKLLQCYVRTLVGNNDASAISNQVGVCDQQYETTTYNCSQVEFTPGTWPVQRTLVDIPATCSDSTWDYGFFFPIGTSSIECPHCDRDELPNYVTVGSPNYGAPKTTTAASTTNPPKPPTTSVGLDLAPSFDAPPVFDFHR